MHWLSSVRTATLLIGLGVGPVLAQPPGLSPEMMQQMQQGMDAARAAGAADAVSAVPQSMAAPALLSEAELQGFFAATKELQALGKEAGAWADGSPTDPATFAKGMQFSAAAQSALSKNGFADPGAYQKVAYNAALAYAVLEQGGKEAMRKEIAAAEAEQQQAMAELEKQLGKDQAAALRAQMAGGQQIMQMFADVPDANITLIEKYRSQMQALQANE